MAPRKGENTKKAAGNAKVRESYHKMPQRTLCVIISGTDIVLQKAEVAAQKQAVIDAQKAAEEDKQWSKGSKSNAKKSARLIPDRRIVPDNN